MQPIAAYPALIQLQTLPCDHGSKVLVKKEGDNLSGSVKDRTV